MQWVGLTGGIASGKSTVAEILKGLGFPVVHADRLAHDAIGPGSSGAELVRARFGDSVFLPSGEVDRAKLGAEIFGDASGAKRKDLEAIIHPEVRKAAAREKTALEASGFEIAIYEIPLLFEKDMVDLFDLIVTVAVSPDVQVARLIARSKLSKEDAEKRISHQLPQDKKIKASDFVVWNNGDLAALKSETEKVATQIRTRANKK